eukprot:9328223-Karenia_brevis.AAC.1
MSFLRNSISPAEQCMRDSCSGTRSVHALVLVGDLIKFPRVQPWIPELLKGNACNSINPDGT